MKRKEKDAMRLLASSDSQKKQYELRESLEKARINRYTKPSRNVREVKELRKKLSFLLTCSREKELAHS